MKTTEADTRKPYNGRTRSLVIAVDVGTTFSGVSYAVLEPGEIPKIHGVTRFPGQEHVAGNSKIPTIMYYDRDGNMTAAGAEADKPSTLSQAEDDEWIKVELFKLRLRPRTMKLDMNGMRLGPLPSGKSAVHVFGDFLRYLYDCTRTFIMDTHANGRALWSAVEHDLQIVMAHPNGWEGAQQSKMRRSAVYAGIVPDTNEGKSRIRFVTEGEASLHACVLNGLAVDVLSDTSRSKGFLIADAGGGTLDISSYRILSGRPLVIEEIAPPDCVFAGSVFVSRRAKAFLNDKLQGSKYGSPDAVDHITKRFDETTKRLFRDSRDPQFIPFGSPLDKDLTVGIRSGQLKLTGDEVAALFEPSVKAAVSSIRAQINASGGTIKSVFLVGGYAASAWLFKQLQERLAPYHISVSRPDSQTSKAVADGAIGFYCDHHVSARMSRFMYGVEYLREYDSSNADHEKRRQEGRICELPSGPKLLLDAFDCILARGIKVEESAVFSRKYSTELTSLSTLSLFEVEIWCYRGGNTVPQWINRNAEDFSTLCVVRADLSPLSGSAEPKRGKSGKTYWTIIFSVEIHFGLTEFKARIKWIDNGQTRYGPASIIYNERGHRAEEEEPDLIPEDDMSTAARSVANSRAVSRAASVAPTSTSTSKRSSSQWGGSAAPPPATSTRSGSVAGPYAPSMTRTNSTQSSRSTASYADTDRGRDKDSRRGGSRTASKLADVLSSVWGGQQAGTTTAPSSARPSRPASPPSAMPGGLDFGPSETPRGFANTRTPTARHSRSSVPSGVQPSEVTEQLAALDSAPAWPFENPPATEPETVIDETLATVSEEPSAAVEEPPAPVEEPPAPVEEPVAPEPEPERVVTPEPVSKSKRGSKIPTPKKGATPAPTVPPSKTPTPAPTAPASKAPTPAPTAPASKVPTPAATPSVSKAASRRASKKATPAETRAQSPARQSVVLPTTEEEPAAPAAVLSPSAPSAALDSVAENDNTNNGNDASFFDTLASTANDALSPVDNGFEHVDPNPTAEQGMPGQLEDLPSLGTGTGSGLGGGLLSLGASLPSLGGWGSPLAATTPPSEKVPEKKEEKKGLLGSWGSWGGGSKKSPSPPPAAVPAAAAAPSFGGWGAKPAATAPSTGWGASKTGLGFGATASKPATPNPSLSRGTSWGAPQVQAATPQHQSPAPVTSTLIPDPVVETPAEPEATVAEMPAPEPTEEAGTNVEATATGTEEASGAVELVPESTPAAEGGEATAAEAETTETLEAPANTEIAPAETEVVAEAPVENTETPEAPIEGAEPGVADVADEFELPGKKGKKKGKKGQGNADPEPNVPEGSAEPPAEPEKKPEDDEWAAGGKKKGKGGGGKKKKGNK